MIDALTRSFTHTTSGLPRAFWFLWTGTLINRIGGLVQPFLSLFLTHQRHLSAGEAGMVVSLFGGGTFFSALVGGTLTDRIGRRATIMLSTISSATIMLIYGLVDSTVLLIVLTPLFGFTLNLYRPAVTALIADITPRQDRARAYGLNYWAINIGAAIAPILAGVMANRNYRLLFIGDALTTIAFGLVIWRAIPETRPVETTRNTNPWWRNLRAPMRDPLVMMLMGLALMVAVIYYQAYVTLPLDMEAKGLSTTDYGSVIAINGAVIVLLGLPATRLVQRLPPAPSLATAALLIGAGFGLIPAANTVPLLMFTVVIWTIGELFTSPILNALIAELAPAEMRGVYMGFFGTYWGLANFIAPALGGFVLGHFGQAWLWGGAAVLGMVISACYLALRPLLDARLNTDER